MRKNVNAKYNVTILNYWDSTMSWYKKSLLRIDLSPHNIQMQIYYTKITIF